jgi:hypothetical protein
VPVTEAMTACDPKRSLKRRLLHWSVRDIEELTRLNFLEKIPARDRRRIEGLKSVMWPTTKKCPKNEAYQSRGS